MKVTAKDVKLLQKWGQEDATIKKMIDKGFQPSIFQTGFYWPSNANWAWQIGIVQIGQHTFEVLTRFGSVEGGREIYVPKYNKNLSRKD